MTVDAELRSKLISADDAAARVRSGDWIDYAAGVLQPDLFDRALAHRKDQLHDVKIRACASFSPRAVLEADAAGDHFLWFNWHFSSYDRAKNVGGRVNYIPMNFGEAPDYYRRFVEPVDLVCIKTCPPARKRSVKRCARTGAFERGEQVGGRSAEVDGLPMVIIGAEAGTDRNSKRPPSHDARFTGGRSYPAPRLELRKAPCGARAHRARTHPRGVA